MGFKFLHHALDVLLLGIAIALSIASSAQVNHDAHVQFIHFPLELRNFLFGDAALMAVDIDKGKFGALNWVLRHLERGWWIVGFKTQFLREKSSSDHQESGKKKSYFFHKIKGE